MNWRLWAIMGPLPVVTVARHRDLAAMGLDRHHSLRLASAALASWRARNVRTLCRNARTRQASSDQGINMVSRGIDREANIGTHVMAFTADAVSRSRPQSSGLSRVAASVDDTSFRLMT